MAIVINVPRDDRFSDIGEGIGELVSALVDRRRDDKDSKTIEGIGNGSVTVSEGLATVSARNRAAAQQAGANYNRDNPKRSFLQLDDAGGAISERVGRFKQPGEVSAKVATFNKERKATDKSAALSEIRSTQINDSPTFSDVSEAGRNRAARNINDQSVDLSRFNKNLYDKLGDLTGDNRIRVDRRNIHYTDYIRGDNGKPITLDKNKAFTLAKQDAEKELQGFLSAQNSNDLITPEEYFGRPQVLPKDKDDTTPIPTANQEVSPVDAFKSFASSASDIIGGMFNAQEPVVTDSDVSIVDPEIRVSEATDSAINANYPLQDKEEWVDVGEVYPMVPQSMMDVVKAGNAGAVAPTYAAMANVPVHVALQLLLQNQSKAPTITMLETKVIPDSVTDPEQDGNINTGTIQR
ncbi:MAG: hypothetical protein COA94_04810 [Rickettsiales bacterium]|nr:MAG: hypothetical protein COA94_04810 [Rickettsiales bacterium]